ncbi:MAG: hypothetical protein AB7O38_22390, partial [Pirellulaceae bacterium]
MKLNPTRLIALLIALPAALHAGDLSPLSELGCSRRCRLPAADSANRHSSNIYPFNHTMKLAFTIAASLLVALVPLHSTAEDGVRWLLQYDGKSLPAAPWTPVGKPNAKLESDGLRLIDADKDFAHYRAAWKPEADAEIIVEATVKVFATTGGVKGKTSLWPWRDGAPVSVLVSDGKHQEGLVLFANQAASHTDRFIPMDTTDKMHTYRLVIRGTDMQMFVDGQRKVEGQGAFWKPADSPEAFIQFGSSAQTATGEALWESVKLGVRKATAALPQPPVKISLGDSWDIPRDGIRQTRPYLYDMGQGLLLMSVAQGPDAFYEPYGLLKSTDAGKTWKPIPGLDNLDTTPLPCLRRPDGKILAISRWTRTQLDGRVVGKTVHLNADATSFEMTDNEIILPKEFTNESQDDQIICERHIWNDADGGATMAVWSRKNVKLPDGRNNTVRMSHLMRSTDEGKTWNYFSTIGPGGEPAVCRLSASEQVAVTRGDRNSRMKQMFSHDGGKTWTKPVELEVGRVLPDLCLLSNGVLACSYGRPASCLMFSLDGGKTWPSHHVISEKVGFNYTSIREISPGRLLYIHDAPKMNGVFIDVEVIKQASVPSSTVSQTWQERAAAHARILSHVKWSPVADTLPNRKGGFFEKGKEYTGVPYSSVRSEGRYIGFDIALRTFLAAVENPRSVLYTENLRGKVSNAAAFYGSVCSAYTSYALGCGIPEVSRRYGPDISQGIVLVEPQAAHAAQVGDVIYTPHATETSGSHVEIITAVTRDQEGQVTSIRVEECRPPTTGISDRSAAKFDAHLATRNKQLFRVTNRDVWR